MIFFIYASSFLFLSDNSYKFTLTMLYLFEFNESKYEIYLDCHVTWYIVRDDGAYGYCKWQGVVHNDIFIVKAWDKYKITRCWTRNIFSFIGCFIIVTIIYKVWRAEGDEYFIKSRNCSISIRFWYFMKLIRWNNVDNKNQFQLKIFSLYQFTF